MIGFFCREQSINLAIVEKVQNLVIKPLIKNLYFLFLVCSLKKTFGGAVSRFYVAIEEFSRSKL